MTDKKVVRVKTTAKAREEAEQAASEWKPSEREKGNATKLRLFAALAWVLAMGTELYAIFGVLRSVPTNIVLLCILLVVIAILAITGSMLWKKANRYDPASKSDTIRFFVQNQLGAIITVLAFLPLIILVLVDNDLTKRQKAIVGGLGAVLMVVATALGADFNPVSKEQYAAEQSQVVQITGKDLVFWTKAGNVFHLCENASAVNLDSKDNTIYSGTVADAHAAGKDRLTLQVESEKKQCGFDTSTP